MNSKRIIPHAASAHLTIKTSIVLLLLFVMYSIYLYIYSRNKAENVSLRPSITKLTSQEFIRAEPHSFDSVLFSLCRALWLFRDHFKPH